MRELCYAMLVIVWQVLPENANRMAASERWVEMACIESIHQQHVHVASYRIWDTAGALFWRAYVYLARVFWKEATICAKNSVGLNWGSCDNRRQRHVDASSRTVWHMKYMSLLNRIENKKKKLLYRDSSIRISRENLANNSSASYVTLNNHQQGQSSGQPGEWS